MHVHRARIDVKGKNDTTLGHLKTLIRCVLGEPELIDWPCHISIVLDEETK